MSSVQATTTPALASDDPLFMLSSEYELVAESAGSVARLRQLVIDLAVRGKLVEQSEHKGTSEALLAEIQQTRRSAGAQGRAMRASDVVGESLALPFVMPASWVSVRLADICVKLGAGSTPLGGKAVYKSSGIKFLRSQNIWNDGLRLLDVAYIDRDTHERMSGTHVLSGDILLNITGASIGRTTVVPDTFDEGNVSQHVAIVRLADKSVRRFIHLTMMASYFQDFVMAVQVGVSREGLSMKKLQSFPIPLPPLAEQKRIVAKVDQLMALCDELEASQARTRDTSDRLTKAALDALTAAEDPEGFDLAWKRVVENFDVLVDRSEKVGELRRTVLDAVFAGRIAAESESAAGWPIVRLGELLRSPLANGRSVPDEAGGFPVLRLSALRGRYLNFYESKEGAWSEAAAKPFIVEQGDLLFVRGNGARRLVGRACIASRPPVRVAFPDTAIRARLDPRIVEIDWVWYYTESSGGRAQIERRARTTAGIFKVSQEDIQSLTVPVPSLGEQRRLLAKVEQLMTLCDELEARLLRAEERAAKLAEAVVRELVS